MKSRRMRWARHVALIREVGNAYNILVENLKGKSHSENIRRRWEYNIRNVS
jgi:hypothetical protein